ncbi:MAG: GntR family transcriptional regulator [Planctomycetes bacterium]|nr:GntR family transcriptional regulator [Planctomycetota bacterium]
MAAVQNGTTRVPKHRAIHEEVRRRILEGVYPPGMQLPPDCEFHKHFQVNKTTVIRALHDLEREGLIVRRQGSGSFVAERKANPIVPGRTFRFGVLCRKKLTQDLLQTDFQGQVVEGALSILGLSGVGPVLPSIGIHEATRAQWGGPGHSVQVLGFGEAAASQVRHPPLEEITAARLDGLIAVSIIEDKFLEDLVSLGLPLVLADSQHERLALNADQVYLDPLHAYRAVVRHFAEMGHRRIHFIGGFVSIPAPSPEMSYEEVAAYRQGRMRIDPDSVLRMSAWRQAMLECGLPAPDRWAHFENPWFVPDEELARRLVALDDDIRPDALVCHGIGQAETMIREFANHGIKIGAAGASDRSAGGPALSIGAPAKDLGAAAAELLISQIQRPSRLRLRVGVPMTFSPPDGHRENES